ncbi:hypothetical protein [Burkholderia sp. SCN-KJ]|uniref:hypothetical protein n=1 Tax=Burkholderia sp. SCN-KJ TaxID=2969248 RepID=UPI002150628D|nr:hypothetical protein [Burkholderia sp. SCN-KJ]MCR4469383.1 hypothetical protein [Burkholderia sp. SCN-KJ]
MPRVITDEVGQRFAEYGTAGERRRCVETMCRGVSRGGAAVGVNGRVGPVSARGTDPHRPAPTGADRRRQESRVASRDQRGLLQPL